MLVKPLSRLRTRLILLVLLIVVPAFGLVLLGSLNQRRIETTRVREGAVAISQLAAANQEAFIENTRQLLATLTQFSFLVQATNRTFCEVQFYNLRLLSPAYANFGLIESNGMLFCSAATTNVQADLADRSYFQRVLETKRFSIGDFQVGRLTLQPALNFGYPVLDEKGGLRRVLFASLRLSPLSESISRIQMPAGGTLMVVDRAGTVLAHFPGGESMIGKSLSDTPVMRRVLANQEQVFEMAGLDEVPRLHAVTAIRNGRSPGLFVVVGIPLEVSSAIANEGMIRNLAVLSLVAMLVLVGAWIYSDRYFLNPVTTLATVAHRLAEGDFTVRTGRFSGVAELVQLGKSFDEMAERLQKRQMEVDRANQQVLALNEELEGRVRERTAELEMTNKELESFSYSVSHDLRAPLRHVDGFVALLQNKAIEKLDAEERHYLETIRGAARQMGALIDDLLGFSRMNRAEMQASIVDLEQMVRETLAGLQPDLKGRNIEWKLGPMPRVKGDLALLRQVWVNLLSNAIKYTRPRDPARIEIGCTGETVGEIVIFVRDNGVGFDQRYAGKLFGVFQRLHRADEFEGTGIGLATVQRIIHRHGGRIWAESKPDEGAVFYFSMAHDGLPDSDAHDHLVQASEIKPGL